MFCTISYDREQSARNVWVKPDILFYHLTTGAPVQADIIRRQPHYIRTSANLPYKVAPPLPGERKNPQRLVLPEID